MTAKVVKGYFMCVMIIKGPIKIENPCSLAQHFNFMAGYNPKTCFEAFFYNLSEISRYSILHHPVALSQVMLVDLRVNA